MVKRTCLLSLLIPMSAWLSVGCQEGSNRAKRSPPGEETQNFIFGGRLVQADEPIAQSLVKISFPISEGESAVCTGSLIDSRWVLTAAHCAQAPAKKIKIELSSGPSQKAPSVERVLIHPLYGQTKVFLEKNKRWDLANTHDVALLSLSQPLEKENHFKLSKRIRTEAGGFLQVAGYGLENYDPLEGLQVGSNRLQLVGLFPSHSSQPGVLTFSQNKGLGACVGDSGGPAFVSEGGQFFIVAIAHQVRNPGQSEICHGTSSFLTVSLYADWIQAQTHIDLF